MSTEINLWLQQFSGFAALMKTATMLGNEEFFLLLLPLIYLCVNHKIGLRLGALILCCDALCGILKIGFALPRPYWINKSVVTYATETSFGFPSSHAQVAAAGWIFLARQSKRTWAYFAAISLIFLIAISRVFLGVHYALDVVGGILVSLAFLALFLKVEPPFSRWFAAQKLVTQIDGALVFSLTILAIFGAVRVLDVGKNAVGYAPFWNDARVWDGIVARCGALFGLGCGAALAQRFARFETSGSFAQKTARFVIAIVGVAFCYVGVARLFALAPPNFAQHLRFVRYALLTIWITFGAPWLLLKIGLLKYGATRHRLDE